MRCFVTHESLSLESALSDGDVDRDARQGEHAALTAVKCRGQMLICTKSASGSLSLDIVMGSGGDDLVIAGRPRRRAASTVYRAKVTRSG